MTKYSAAAICLLIALNIYLILKVQNYKLSQDDFSGSIYISSDLIRSVNRTEMPPHDQSLYQLYKDSESRFAFVSMDEAKERGYDDEIFHVLHEAYSVSSNIFELLYLFGINNRKFCKLRFQSAKSDEEFSFRTIVVEGINEPYFKGHAPPVLMIIYDVYTGEILNMGFYSAFF